MTSMKQDSDFGKEMSANIDRVLMSDSALDAAINWIASNLNPDDVFDKSDLETWAENNGYIKE